MAPVGLRDLTYKYLGVLNVMKKCKSTHKVLVHVVEINEQVDRAARKQETAEEQIEFPSILCLPSPS